MGVIELIKDLILGFGMAIFSIVTLVESRNLVSANKWDVFGPDGFPKIVAYVLLALSIILIISSLRKRNAGKNKFSLTKLEVIVLVSIIAYAFLLPILGFLIATALFILSIQLLLTYDIKKTRISMVITTVVVTGSVYIVFEKLLNVNLP